MFKDSDPKRVCRFLQYRRFKKLWDVSGFSPDRSVVLAGDEAAEAGLLRHYLQCKPETTIFVDTEPAGLKKIKKAWPEALTYFGKVETLLKRLYSDSSDEVDFLNLDFCGYLNKAAEESLKLAKDIIADKGIVSYTFVRGRESSLTPSWKKIEAEALKVIDSDPRYSRIDRTSVLYMDTVRFLGYSGLIKQYLGPDFESIFLMRYKSDQSPMGVVAFQRMPAQLRTPKWRKELVTYSSMEERNGDISFCDSNDRLRDLVLELAESLEPSVVAEVFNVSRTSLAAWLAHKTRGTYQKK